MWTALKPWEVVGSPRTVHLKPYWGKPAVRNFRGGRGNPKLEGAPRGPLPSWAPQFVRGRGSGTGAPSLLGSTICAGKELQAQTRLRSLNAAMVLRKC